MKLVWFIMYSAYDFSLVVGYFLISWILLFLFCIGFFIYLLRMCFVLDLIVKVDVIFQPWIGLDGCGLINMVVGVFHNDWGWVGCDPPLSMDTPDNSSSSSINRLFELVNFVKSWIPGIRWSQAQPSNEGNASQSQSGNVSRSRDFWMPDHSCRVCYECDSQFTVFNRRHHCRLCGRVFCAKCTTNSVPAPSDCPRHGAQEDWERIRVCNYCFKQWSAQGTTVARVDNDNGTQSHAPPSPAISRSASATSVASSKSSCTYQSSCSTVGSTPYPAGPYQRVPYTSTHSPPQSARMDSVMVEQHSLTSERSTGASFASAIVPPSPNQFGYCFERYLFSCLTLHELVLLTSVSNAGQKSEWALITILI